MAFRVISVLCDIILMPFNNSPKELANLRNEIEKRQPQNGEATDAAAAIESGVEAAPASTAAPLNTTTTTTSASAPIISAAAEITAS